MITLNSQSLKLLAPLILFLSLILLAKSSWFSANPAELAFGITFDLTVTVPLVYFLVIRKSSIPKITVVPVFILGVVVSGIIIPPTHQFALTQVKQWVLPLVELMAATVVYLKLRKIRRNFNQLNQNNYDFFTSLKTAVNDVIPAPANVLFATEIAIFHYGFLHWKKHTLHKNEFSYHKESGSVALLWVILLLVIVETFVFHLLLMQWSLLAAWILSGISLYSGLQLFGIIRSLNKRPIVVSDNCLQLRYGILAEVSLPYSEISKIELNAKDIEPNDSIKKLSPLGNLESHNTVIYLKQDAKINSLYGIKKSCKAIALHVDDKQGFKNAVESKLSFDNQYENSI